MGFIDKDKIIESQLHVLYFLFFFFIYGTGYSGRIVAYSLSETVDASWIK